MDPNGNWDGKYWVIQFPDGSLERMFNSNEIAWWPTKDQARDALACMFGANGHVVYLDSKVVEWKSK